MLTIDWGKLLMIAAAAMAGIQLCYYLLIFSRLAFYKAPKKKVFLQHPVSVVLCARDEASNLAKHLPGILVQNYHTSFETLVVNDNSEDDSKYILDDLQKVFRSLRIIALTQEAKLIEGKKFPLSMGIREAKNEILLLTDADCVPASEFWIEKMQNAYQEDTEIVLGYSPYFKRKGFLNKLIRFETFHTALQYLSYALAGLPYMGVGRNLSYKRSLFMKNKGFSSINQIPGGDDDLFINKVATKKNTAIAIDPDTFTQSVPKRKWGEWWHQKNRHYSTSKYYKPVHKFLLGLYSFSHFFTYVGVILCAIFYSWQIALIIFGSRFLVQAILLYLTMSKLKEKDLWAYFLLFDIWQIFYYILFFPALFKKAPKRW